jgi:hypothetical protein
MFSKRITPILTSVLFCLCVPVGATLAADPPDFVNYQGVLRDADDAPLDGDHDMVFRFWSAEILGHEILVDSHTAAGTGTVTVSGGLFNVQLGGGAVSDGSGPGTYDTLSKVFADYSAVWLGIQIGGETLSPRVRVVSSPYAANAMHLGGRESDEFVDTTSSAQSKLGMLILGQSSGTGSTFGLEAYGTAGGAYFEDSDSSGYARVGYGHYGIRGYGDSAGGYFRDLNSSGYAYVGYGHNGVQAYGDNSGGYFADLDDSGYAYVGHGHAGISAYGTDGGYFESTFGGYATVGDGLYGITAYGRSVAALFDNNFSGVALLANSDNGVTGWGHESGGYFWDTNSAGDAWVGYGDRGIWARGLLGGTFSHYDDVTYWADVARERDGTTYKIRGTGEVAFVQNHPYEKDKVVVYAAPEGDEVATYTRGTARLLGGEARVDLGETFAWVTNPDIGLTVHLTPVGEWSDLYVAEKSTSEILVRSRAGDGDVAFDYLVFGLRIGFEQHATVQIKDREAFLPPPGASEQFFAEHPELQRFNALERFKATRVALGESGEIDMQRAEALVAAIDENREEIISAARAEVEEERARRVESFDDRRGDRETAPDAAHDETTASVDPRRSPPSSGSESTALGEKVAEEQTRLPVAEPVETGDVLVLDPERPGLLRRAASMVDPDVVGIAAGPSYEAEGGGLEAPMAETRYALVKVDAGYGEIRPGDPLVTSPTPGHAMRAPEVDSGTILGKALDSLEVGTGSIRVLLITR